MAYLTLSDVEYEKNYLIEQIRRDGVGNILRCMQVEGNLAAIRAVEKLSDYLSYRLKLKKIDERLEMEDLRKCL